jgi:hypothetical protein
VAYLSVPGAGIYRTTNEALSSPQWLQINKNLTDLTITKVRANQTSSSLVYAVGANGIYRLELSRTSPYVDLTPPGTIANLTGSSTASTSVQLLWTTPGNDSAFGNPTGYSVRYATSPITEGNWNSATPMSPQPTPYQVGTSEHVNIYNLTPNSTYYFAIKTSDADGNQSGLSNVLSISLGTENCIMKSI